MMACIVSLKACGDGLAVDVFSVRLFILLFHTRQICTIGRDLKTKPRRIDYDKKPNSCQQHISAVVTRRLDALGCVLFQPWAYLKLIRLMLG